MQRYSVYIFLAKSFQKHISRAKKKFLLILISEGKVISKRPVLGNQRFPVQVQLAMCRGSLSAVIVQLISKCL